MLAGWENVLADSHEPLSADPRETGVGTDVSETHIGLVGWAMPFWWGK